VWAEEVNFDLSHNISMLKRGMRKALQPNAFGSVYILGGHKLATSYFTKIDTAQKKGILQIENLYAVTEDPKAQIFGVTTNEHILRKSGKEFLVEAAFSTQPKSNDVLIPDHTAKHVLLEAFWMMAEKADPDLQIGLSALHADWQSPFLHKADDQAIWAISHATWICPADCAEPEVCPHTQQKRDWDFNVSLKPLLAILQAQGVKTYEFFCENFLDEISFIRLSDIHTAFSRFANSLRKLSHPQKFVVATHSHCHGILGQIEIRKTSS